MARLHAKYSVHKLRPASQLLTKEGRKSTLIGSSVDVDNAESPFVLFPRKDPAALVALKCYALNCEPELAQDIRQWIELIRRADQMLGKQYGTQGERNKPFCGRRFTE